MAEKACHGFGSTTQVGLTQALGPIMKIREVVYIAIISVLAVISLLSYNSARRSQEILDKEMFKIKEQHEQQFSIYQQQQKEYQAALDEYKKQQAEYKIEMENWKRENANYR